MTRRILILMFLAVVGFGVWYGYSPMSYTDAGLAAYVAAERLDPIFAIAGTDPDQLQQAVNDFSAMGDLIAAHYSGAERSAVTSLYPIRFLQSLPKLEAARQMLLIEPTIVHARTYHALLSDTIRTYASDTARIATLVRSTKSAYPTIGFLAGTTTPDYIATQIQAAGDDALSIQLTKENARYECLNDAARCPSINMLLEDRARAIATSTVVPAPTLNKTMQKVASVTERINGMNAIYSRTEPIALAFASTCVPSSTVAYVKAYYLASKHGFTRKLVPIHDAYFFDIDALYEKFSTPQYAFLRAAGVHWMYQNPGNIYECPDAGFDQLSAGRLISVLESLRAASATSTEARSILSRAVISAADVVPYVASQATIDSTTTNAFTERYIEGASDFDQVVRGALNDNSFLFTASAKEAAIRYSYVIAVRNYASALLLLGNPTVVPKPHSLFSSNTPSPLESLNLRSYINDVSKVVSDTVLVDEYKKYFDTERFVDMP